MTSKEIKDRFVELDRLYGEHAKNQSYEDYQDRNKLRLELHDLFLILKPYIKKQTQLQWYEPTYNYAITGNVDYIESVRIDLAHIISQYEGANSSEKV
ncbi:MAG: hypothetical protein JSV47_03315 [Deltaproteobacteria bacterium]|nr:MAG: hypothetical protein JSV47_03315 [Deltaproteobacteria bacterium]